MNQLSINLIKTNPLVFENLMKQKLNKNQKGAHGDAQMIETH